MYIENISARDLRQYVNDSRYEIIDLRDFREFRRSHVINAVHLDSDNIISGDLSKITKRSVILYCDRGGESIRMAKILASRGYDVKNVIGGFFEIKNFTDIIG